MRRILLILAVGLRVVSAAAPVIHKVEPPDWPGDAAGITVRLLLTGANLKESAVHSALTIGAPRISPSGTHLFVDVRIPPHAKPGIYPIEVVTPEGATEAPFAIRAPLPAAGRFQGFSSDDVVYLILPDRFADGDPSNDDPAVSRGLFDRKKSRSYHGGDLDGIIQHLPYLKDLGVTALWLTPVYDNSNRLSGAGAETFTDYHGYGAVDFYAVDEHLGTLEKFRELVDRAHALGLKVIQDQVANHTGPAHPWVHDPPTASWYHGAAGKHVPNTWRTWTLMDPHASPAAQASTLDGWFADILPDLNQDDPEVARYLIQNTLWWIGRTGIDGIREDTLPYVPRRFWREWTAAIRQRYPRLNVVGEVFDPDPALVAFFQGGHPRFDGVDSGVDTLFDFPLQFTIRKVFAGQAPLNEIPKLLSHDDLYHDPNRLVTFIDLHDLPRFLHEPGATLEALQQVFTLLLTTRGIPMLYYGDEVGMTGGDDPDNRRDFPGGWTGDARDAFTPAGREAAEQTLFTGFQRLARLRAELEPLRRGTLLQLLVDDEAYAFARVTREARALVVFNHSSQPATLRVPLEGSGIANGAVLTDALGGAAPAQAHDGMIQVRLPARSSAIYR